MSRRFSRNELLFGRQGQARISATTAAVVGVGGLGSHLVQQLAYLGVGALVFVDADSVEESNLNRLIGARPRDVGAAKVEVCARLAKAVNPALAAVPIAARVEDPRAHEAISSADVVFGCFDRDLPRLTLTHIASELGQPYFDLASDSGGGTEPWYGGRVVFAHGDGCLSCLGLLDQEEIRRDGLAPDQRAAHDHVYGLDTAALDRPGPAVVSVNGVVASLAVTLFIETWAGIQAPPRHLIYRGEQRRLLRSVDEPAPNCFYCARWREAGQSSVAVPMLPIWQPDD